MTIKKTAGYQAMVAFCLLLKLVHIVSYKSAPVIALTGDTIITG